MKTFIEFLNEAESVSVKWNNTDYWINKKDYDDYMKADQSIRNKTKFFAFLDPELQNVAKVNGKTLMLKNI